LEPLKFEVTILGSGGAIPNLRRNASAQYINVQERHFLIDCAEGTQLQLRRFEAPVQRLHAIFISHLHGDHYLGLMGLLSTMHLLGRKNALQLIGPPELKQILDLQMHVGKTTLGYALNFTPLIPGESQLVYEDNVVSVTSFPLKHRITCWGYRIDEKPFRKKLNKQALAKYKLPVSWMKRVIEGENFVSESGEIIANELITEEPESPKSFAYCSDTMYDERIVLHIMGVNLLYHEATFAEDQARRAKETFHSTGKQAAQIAKMAGVNQLVIGHYSARYHTPDTIANEARLVFENTIAAEDGMKIRI
jgi:ribonuclease Z